MSNSNLIWIRRPVCLFTKQLIMLIANSKLLYTLGKSSLFVYMLSMFFQVLWVRFVETCADTLLGPIVYIQKNSLPLTIFYARITEWVHTLCLTQIFCKFGITIFDALVGCDITVNIPFSACSPFTYPKYWMSAHPLLHPNILQVW